MCHLSMKLSDMFDQNPPCTLTNLGETHSNEKPSHGLVIAKIKSKCPGEQKNMPPQKNLSRGSLSNWCDTYDDADTYADICKTICRRGST